MLALTGSLGVARAAEPPATRHALAVTLGTVPTRVALDRVTSVRGTVTDRATGRPAAQVRVALQIGSPRGWAAPAGAVAVTDARGRFTLRAPTHYYGTHRFRAYVAAQPLGPDLSGLAAGSAVRSVTVPVPYRPAGRASAGAAYPEHFDPCRPVPYRINYAGAPRNARSLVAMALAKARAATGLTFVYAGSTSGVPFSSQPRNGMPERGIGFAWSTPRQVSQLAGGNIGVGGGWWTGDEGLTSAGVSIDRTFTFRPGWTGPNSIGGLLLHELGHALGLKHVNDRAQQMYPTEVGAPNGNYNAGDLAALRRIGLDSGCR